MSQLKLTRHTTDRFIAGVCGGLADYLGVDATLVRVAFVILGLASGIGIPLYLVLMLVVPKEMDDGQPLAHVVQTNLDEFGQTLSEVSDNSNGRQTAALLLILMGGYLLLYQLGLIGSGLFLPLVIIMAGLWVLRLWWK